MQYAPRSQEERFAMSSFLGISSLPARCGGGVLLVRLLDGLNSAKTTHMTQITKGREKGRSLRAVLLAVAAPVCGPTATDCASCANGLSLVNGACVLPAATSTPTATAPTMTVTPTPTPTPPCFGDCHSDGHVSIDEIITMVNIALDATPISACAAGNANQDSRITVDEIVRTVSAALSGCGG